MKNLKSQSTFLKFELPPLAPNFFELYESIVVIQSKPQLFLIVFAFLLPAFGFTQTKAAIIVDDVGPMVGHVDWASAQLLIRRGSTAQIFRLEVSDEKGTKIQTVEGVAEAENDFVAKFHVTELKPDTNYRYRVTKIDDKIETVVADGDKLFFKTTKDLASKSSRTDSTASICFVSCVDIEKNPLWDGISDISPDLLCLMGDTPYIDSSDLEVVRQRHREFLNIPGLAEQIGHTPTVGTWDDHDFGRNNGNGRNMLKGKPATRKGFVEYRAHQQFGTGTEGVYHSVDLGMVEVFFLDPRYFSQTASSPVDSNQTTCFGTEQWTWLLKELKESKAPFKVLSFGSVWQDKKNAEVDDMFTYWYERDALLDFVSEENIAGVVLLGGDIHVSRHLVHPLRVGYDLHDFIVSPGHKRTITELDVFHPSLRWSLVEGHQFLSMTADGTKEDPTLTVKFHQGADKVNREMVIRLSELTSKPETGIQRGLRANWSFDKDFSNSSRLGQYVDATPKQGVSIEAKEGRFGGAAKLIGQRAQFLNVPRNPLDDNSDQHSVSIWFKPNSLPKHGTNERQFLFESTAEGKPSDKSAWSLSLGLRAAADPAKICLQLYTHTLVPAAGPEQAPSARSQGGFDFLINRDALSEWTQAVVVFETKQLKLYLNGVKAKSFQLPIPGPASEFGGIIIGGHRNGSGRNFDGSIDEVAIWSRPLTGDEIKKLTTLPVGLIK